MFTKCWQGQPLCYLSLWGRFGSLPGGTEGPPFYSALRGWGAPGRLVRCLWGRGGVGELRKDTPSSGSLTEMTLRGDPSHCVCESSHGSWPQESASR